MCYAGTGVDQNVRLSCGQHYFPRAVQCLQAGDASDALAAHLINAASTLTVATSSSATMPPAFALAPAPILWTPPRVDP